MAKQLSYYERLDKATQYLKGKIDSMEANEKHDVDKWISFFVVNIGVTVGEKSIINILHKICKLRIDVEFNAQNMTIIKHEETTHDNNIDTKNT